MKKKVVLLGDSIRMIGYGTKVPEMLGDEYEVFQPAENCRFAKYTLRMLFDLRSKIADADVIHWNNGLWDTCRLFGDGATFSSEEEYVENILRIAGLLKKITPNVIFATTTPVRGAEATPVNNLGDATPGGAHNDNTIIARFNSLVVPRLTEMGVQINDLYSVVAPNVSEYIREDDKIHLSEAGIDVCATRVVEAIKSILE